MNAIVPVEHAHSDKWPLLGPTFYSVLQLIDVDVSLLLEFAVASYQIRYELIQMANSETVFPRNDGNTVTKSRIVRDKNLGRGRRDEVPYIGGVALSDLRELSTLLVKVRIHKCACRTYGQPDTPIVEKTSDSPVGTQLP